MTDIGMNLSGVNYWSTEFPFIDRVKSARDWQALGASPGPIEFDANGYPKAVPNGASNLYIMVPIDPPGSGTSNVYVIRYSGTATFGFVDGVVLSSEPGRIVIRAEGTSQLQGITVQGLSASDPLTDLHVVRADQEALFDQGEIFNPTFLDKIEPFSTMRFMDWNYTNNSPVVDWSDRTTLNKFTWGGYTQGVAVPIEVMVELANRTHNDMWFNIPAEATDDYVRHAVEYIRDHLDPDLKLNLEYSNEVWNWTFAQSHTAYEKGNQLFGHDANGDGRIDSMDPAENVSAGHLLYYGYRAAQIANMANAMYGDQADARLATVISTFPEYLGIEQYVFDGVALAHLGTVDRLFDSYAITTYFGANMSGMTEADRATMLRWARSGEAGVDAAFEAIANGTGLEYAGSIKYLKTVVEYQGQVAAAHGLNLVAYEGGMGFWASNYAPADQPAIMDLMARLAEDPRMGDMYLKMVGDFAAAGGSLLMAFVDAAQDAVLSSFGIMKSIYHDTHAYRALTSVTSGQDDVFTPLASYVLGGAINNLTYTGAEAFTGVGNARDNIIHGGSGDNVLRGRGGNDTLWGGTGNDLLDGGTGRDRMYGGAGNDIYLVDDHDDQIFEDPNGGIDEVRTAFNAFRLQAELEKLTFTGQGGFEGRGNTGMNVIQGGVGDDRLLGYAGDDIMFGGDGNDILNGGAGNDRLVGGRGDDNYTVKEAGDEVIEEYDQGHDTVRFHMSSWVLPDNVEDMIFRGEGGTWATGNALVNRIVGGAGDDRLYGLGGNDVLVGGAGNDLLDGGIGADRMEGGLGDDVYVVDWNEDQAVELADEGTDEVRTAWSGYTLGDNLENLSYTGAYYFTGIGNALSNRLVAGDGGSSLYGEAGADVLIGGAGSDRLDGGTGADRMVGGAGDDVYVVDELGDVVEEAPGGGRDQVRTYLARYTLGAELEDLSYLGNDGFTGYGNAAANRIEGNAGDDFLYGMAGTDILVGGGGNDVLDGGTGADSMFGGAGDDIYYVDDQDGVSELPGQGIDEVRTANSAYTLTANVENLLYTGTGTGSFYGGGNASDNVIRGGRGPNALYGFDGADQLYGGDGDDLLDGGSGADRMAGGLGNDTYVVDDVRDTVTDTGGTDTVRSSVSYAIAAEIENLQLAGTAAINGTGNAQANTISGNDAANTLLGLDGDDYLYGGGGNDRLEGGNGRDNLSGDAGNDTLLGGAGDDTLFGGDGDDILSGDAGRDVLFGGNGADTYRFASGDLAATTDLSDVIYGFSHGEGDRLDFSAFDANPATIGRDAFRFVGDAAFGGTAGELRAFASGGAWIVQGDLNGDRVADFVLTVGGDAAQPLVTADFVL